MQVDYEEAAREAVSLETDEDRARHAARPRRRRAEPRRAHRAPRRTRVSAPASSRACWSACVETLVIAREGLGADHQVLWYGPLAYALRARARRARGGLALGVLPMERREIRGWTASLVLLALGLGPALLIAMFRLRRDVFHEQMPPLPVLAGVLGVAGGIARVPVLLRAAPLRGRASAAPSARFPRCCSARS